MSDKSGAYYLLRRKLEKLNLGPGWKFCDWIGTTGAFRFPNLNNPEYDMSIFEVEGPYGWSLVVRKFSSHGDAIFEEVIERNLGSMGHAISRAKYWAKFINKNYQKME